MAPLPFDATKLSPSHARSVQGDGRPAKSRREPLLAAPICRADEPSGALQPRSKSLGFYLKFQGRLPRDVYQFVVLSVARDTGAAFEWIDHVRARGSGRGSRIGHRHAATGRTSKTGAFPAPYDLAAQSVGGDARLGKDIPQSIQDE